MRMERARIKTPDEIKRFLALAERAQEIVVQNMKREVDFNDAPEEFRGMYFQTSKNLSFVFALNFVCSYHLFCTRLF